MPVLQDGEVPPGSQHLEHFCEPGRTTTNPRIPHSETISFASMLFTQTTAEGYYLRHSGGHYRKESSAEFVYPLPA